MQSGLREGDSRGASAGGGLDAQASRRGRSRARVVLLVGAGLLTRTFLSLQRLEPGFDLTNIVTAAASLEDKRYQTAEQIQLLFDRTLERVHRFRRESWPFRWGCLISGS